MALNSKYVTLKTILDKIYRDNAYDTEISFGDAAEWCAEAMDLIAVPMQYVDKEYDITIEDYRGGLPCDMHNITNGAIVDKATNIPLRASFDTAYLSDRVKSADDRAAAKGEINNNIDPTLGTFQISKDKYPVIPSDIDYIRHKQNDNYIYYRPTANDTETQHTYTLNNNYIFTSLKDGTLRMYYKAFPVDSEGFPLIPEDTKFIRAVASYITWKIDWKLYRMNKIARDIVESSEKEWLFAVGSAKNKALTFTLDQAESFKNMVTKLIPNYSYHSSTYRYSTEQETIILKNSR